MSSKQERLLYLLNMNRESIIDIFSFLIDNYTSSLLEKMTLESKNDFIYLSDLDTYELYLVSAKNPEEIDITWKDAIGKKCYEVLQGRNSPCPFCTNHLLEKDMDYIWKHHNDMLNGDYILKDRLVEWNGKVVRMEIVINVTDSKRLDEVLWRSLATQNLLSGCGRLLLGQGGVKESYEKIVKKVSSFFGAESCTVFTVGREKLMAWGSVDGEISTFHDFTYPDKRTLRSWRKKFKDGSQVLVRTPDERLREKLHDDTIQSLCIAPVLGKEEVLGAIVLKNINKNWTNLSVLTFLGGYMASILEREQLEDEKTYLQKYDVLTGALNLEGFKMKVRELMAKNPDKKYALWYSDLKNFKYINDMYGYDIGDQLLKHQADMIAAGLKEHETFCRISADNYSILKSFEKEADIYEYYKILVENLTQFEPISSSRKQKLDLISGIYVIEDTRHLSIEEMLNRANMAQKTKKSRSGGGYIVYNDTIRNQVVREMEMEAGMQDALRNGEFQLYIQPQIPLSGKGTIWAEILVRWIKPDGKVIMPGEFIGLFERDGLIIQLDKYIFEEACRYQKKWQEMGRHIGLAVNVSRISMLQENFVEEYTKIRDKYGIEEDSMELEFTENIVVENLEQFTENIIELQKNGFRCAMDDFGTSQSSLNVLKNLPLDVLKLDRLFFRQGEMLEERGRAVVRCIVDMSKALSMRSVAEGVEVEVQVEELKELGCDYVQGYAIARPMPANQLLTWLESRV